MQRPRGQVWDLWSWKKARVAGAQSKRDQGEAGKGCREQSMQGLEVSPKIVLFPSAIAKH